MTVDIYRQLRDSWRTLKCDLDNDFVEQNWEKWFPGITPNELIALFSVMPPAYGKPKITLSFEGGLSTSRLARLEIDFGKQITAVICLDKRSLMFESVEIPVEAQNQSHAKRILAAITVLAQTINKPAIQMAPTHENGGYSWARFGAVPSKKDWASLKEDLQHYRLNADRNAISYDNKQSDGSGFRSADESPYEALVIKGALTADETGLINRALRSDDPKDLWLLSDMGRKVGEVKDHPEMPPHDITVGKALLCGLGWDGSLDVTPGSASYQRLCAYMGGELEKAAGRMKQERGR